MLFLNCLFPRPGARHEERKTGGFAVEDLVRRGIAARFVFIILVATAVGCASSANGDDKPTGSGSSTSHPPDEERIDFVPSEALALAPSQRAALTVEVSPLRRQNVTFEVLTETTGFDGFLLESEVRVRDDGTATVELQAPSGPADFIVRASLPEGSRAVRPINVRTQGYGSIDVIPKYEGTRIIPQWTASAYINETCENLESFWGNGPLVATGATRATITDVSSGVPIAVTIRGGQLAAGCATLTNLRAGDRVDVEVEISDRPVAVNSGTLLLSLGIDSSTTIFASHLEQTVTLGRSFFRGEEQSDAVAILTSMAGELTGGNKTDFESAISTYDLVTVVSEIYAQGSPVTDKVGSLLNNAAAQITGPDVFVGTLTLQGSSSQFLLTKVVGVDATASGFFQGSTWVVSAESGDMVVLGGTLSYEPLRWLVAIVEDRLEEGTTVPEILAGAAQCTNVAAEISSTLADPPFSDCDEICLEDLCNAAILTYWQDLPSKGPGLTTLQLGISGKADLFGSAQIETMTGSWVGRLGTEDETSVGGTAQAELFVEE